MTLITDAAADIASIIDDTDETSVSLTINAIGATGIESAPYKSGDVNGVEAAARDRYVIVTQATIIATSAVRDSPVVIDATNYEIKALEPDDVGSTRLYLRLAP